MLPLWSKLGVLFFAALAVWMFAIARNPRDWRRLFQGTIQKDRKISVNVNKRLDEVIKKWAVNLLALFIFICVVFVVTGALIKQKDHFMRKSESVQDRINRENLTRMQKLTERERAEEMLRQAATRPQER